MELGPEYSMQQAYKLAEQAFEEDEVPIGAIVVADNKIIGKGLNVSQLEEFLDVLQEMPDEPKLFPKEEQPKDEEIH